MSGNVTDMAKTGRPPGLLMNTEAARYVLGPRPQSWWATEAGMSTGHLSAVISGTKGCTPEAAERIARAVEVAPGVLFPELVEFNVEVRRFTASRIVEVAA